jgi:hypothetical protein
VADQRDLDGLPMAAPRRSPRWVDPSVGARPARPFEIGAVLVSIAIIVGAVLWFLWTYLDSGPDPDVGLIDGSLVETLEETDSGSCIWTVVFVLSADRSEPVTITDVHVDRVAPVRLRSADSLVPTGFGTEGTAAGRLVHEFFVCPESIGEIDHGRLVITYEQAGESARTARFGW